MNRKDFNTLVDIRIKSIKETLAKKGDEYSKDKEVFKSSAKASTI